MTSAICKRFASIAIDEKKTALTPGSSVDSANEKEKVCRLKQLLIIPLLFWVQA
jgi:hypothetical protein